MIDFSDCKNVSSIKKKVRKELTKDFMEYLVAKHGEDNVTQTAVNVIAVGLNDYKDDDGFLHEICAEVKIIAKPFTDNDSGKREVESYDRYQAGMDFKHECALRKGETI